MISHWVAFGDNYKIFYALLLLIRIFDKDYLSLVFDDEIGEVCSEVYDSIFYFFFLSFLCLENIVSSRFIVIETHYYLFEVYSH